MRNYSFQYKIINLLVLGLCFIIFFKNYNVQEILDDTALDLFIILASVAWVHILKAARLYFAIYGSKISLHRHLKTYSKVTPASILLPFKLGEFFRMYCYGTETGSAPKGILTILLDRFMDTLALLTMLTAVCLVSGSAFDPFVFALIVFLAGLLGAYFLFPGLSAYCKKFLLLIRATPKRLQALSFLEKLKVIYREITAISKGRGIILYFLSLFAWGVEIGAVLLISFLKGEADPSDKISIYLRAALSGAAPIELRQFIFFSLLLMIITYIAESIHEYNHNLR